MTGHLAFVEVPDGNCLLLSLLGWNIAQEEFWKPIENIANLLKVRFSYGELGNQNINNWYPTYRTISIGSLNGDWLQNGLSPNTSSVGGLINTALTWEKVLHGMLAWITDYSIIA